MESQDYVDEKNKRLVALVAKKDWLLHPTTIDYLKAKQKEVERISQLLSESEGLEPERRQSLFGERKAHRYDIEQMSRNVENEIGLLKSQLGKDSVI